MTDRPAPGGWSDPTLAAALLAVDPVGLGGVALRAGPGPGRDRWLALLRTLLPADAPMRRVPAQIADGRLLGGLDLAATLRSGRRVAERGILVEADGGVVLLAMAERLPSATAGRIAAVLDQGQVVLERDGLALRLPTRLGVVALDEGVGDDERPPAALLERLAIHVDLASVAAESPPPQPSAVAKARLLLPEVATPDAEIEALCAVTVAFGVGSLRVADFALRTARIAAALAGRDRVGPDEVAAAVRLVLAPRATMIPSAEPEADSPPPPPPPDTAPADDEQAEAPADPMQSLQEMAVAAARAAIPPGLLARLAAGQSLRRSTASAGDAGASRNDARRGRPIGSRAGELRTGARLDIVETLRAAAPWQALRRTAAAARTDMGPTEMGPRPRIIVRPEDFRIARFRRQTGTTAIFAVDASGSSAMHRLGEAKGAVEMLLADCYVRRDQVALIAFRGRDATLLLPPTRSLVRAKRSLAGLPGGGGTPLAAGIEAASALAGEVRRTGRTALVVLLTDGKANVARDGTGGRELAAEHALFAARRLRADGVSAMLVDTAPRPQPAAQRLSEAMGAAYLVLPQADSLVISAAVRGMADLRA